MTEKQRTILNFKNGEVEKKITNHPLNKLSSIQNEIFCLEKFGKNHPYAPEILKVDKTSYLMKQYSFDLGNKKQLSEQNIRRILFFCTLENILNQLQEIQKILKDKGINHRDIHPGNFLFSEKDKKLKLIDFYWAITNEIEPYQVPNLNKIYKDDDFAFSKIKEEIINIEKKIQQEVILTKTKLLPQVGLVYYDGSAKHPGKTYHPIDISYYSNNLYHRDINCEFQQIIQNIQGPVETVTDIGCAAGFYIFNFIRLYKLKRITGYEADPSMFAFLKEVKNIFHLNELQLYPKIDLDTEFQSTDLTICMNVHMWLVKQLGKKADVIMSNLIKNSKQMFFQTASAQSSGMYVVKSLKTKNDIENYLKDLGAKNIKFLLKSKKNGRYLYQISN